MTEDTTTLEPSIFCNLTEQAIGATPYSAMKPLIDFVCAAYHLSPHNLRDVKTAMRIILNSARCN